MHIISLSYHNYWMYLAVYFYNSFRAKLLNWGVNYFQTLGKLKESIPLLVWCCLVSFETPSRSSKTASIGIFLISVTCNKWPLETKLTVYTRSKPSSESLIRGCETIWGTNRKQGLAFLSPALVLNKLL